MNTKKVFTAFNNEGIEILLYKKDNDTYINLNSDNNEVYPKKDIDIATIRPLSDSLRIMNHMLRTSIKRKYKKDRETLLKTKDILLGYKGRVSNLKKDKIKSGLKLYGIPLYSYLYEWEHTDKELGLYMFYKNIKLENKFGTKYDFKLYKNLYDQEDYLFFDENNKNISYVPNFDNGLEYVYSKKETLEDMIEKLYVEKKEAYEYSNEIRRKILKLKGGKI